MLYTAVNSVKLQSNHVVPRLQQKWKMEKSSTGKCMKFKEFPLTSSSKTQKSYFLKFSELIRACHYLSLFSFSCASNASAPLISITREVSESKSWPKKIHTRTQNNPITNLYALSGTGVSEISTGKMTLTTVFQQLQQRKKQTTVGQLLRKLKICRAEHLYPVSIVNFAVVSLRNRIFKNLLQHSYHTACLSTGQQNRQKEKVLLLYAGKFITEGVTEMNNIYCNKTK